MDSEKEQSYMEGYNAAYLRIMREAMSQLGYETSEVAHADWMLERESAISALREACGDFGDNDWENDLNLSDIIEKHLTKHLHGSNFKSTLQDDEPVDYISYLLRQALTEMEACQPITGKEPDLNWLIAQIDLKKVIAFFDTVIAREDDCTTKGGSE